MIHGTMGFRLSELYLITLSKIGHFIINDNIRGKCVLEFFRMDVMKRGIDQGMLEKVVRKQISNERIKILGISNRFLSDKGVNFLSDLLEVSIRYTVIPKNDSKKSERSVDVIIKLEPTNGALFLVCQQDLFLTELKVLRDVIPKVEELIGLQIGPMLLYGCENPHILVMEHLCRRKFIMKDRQKGLSFEYCRLLIEKLAKLHAGSVAVFEKVNKRDVYVENFVNIAALLLSSHPNRILSFLYVHGN